jgi:hypothetical protein
MFKTERGNSSTLNKQYFNNGLQDFAADWGERNRTVFPVSDLDPFLKMGVTFAHFLSSGTSPFWMDLLNIRTRAGTSSFCSSWRSWGPIPSGPGAEAGFRLQIFSLTILYVISIVSKLGASISAAEGTFWTSKRLGGAVVYWWSNYYMSTKKVVIAFACIYTI